MQGTARPWPRQPPPLAMCAGCLRNESFARDLFADVVDNLPVDPINSFGDNWESAGERCVEMIRIEFEKILPSEGVQAAAAATFAAYVTQEGDPSRLRALCFSDEVLAAWLKHFRFLMDNRVGDREFTTTCIPVYDILALAGLAAAQRMESYSGGTGSANRIMLRPAMSYQHGLRTVLHANIQTLLRRDGYPVAWSMLKKAWVGVMPYIMQRIEGYTLGLGGPQTEAGILMGNSVMAAAHFQLYTDVVDLMFAEPLQQYESTSRNQVSE
eukprot:15481345-Alexandrium_andersonii.AAC.1